MEREPREPLLVIVGPTASGKTDLAVRLAGDLGGEVVSADSVQVYRHFDIGSGKPTAAERERAVHHLIDCVEPGEPMDAAIWVGLAEEAIARIRTRNLRPIVCGGTFLWIKALVFGLAAAPPGDPALRARHRRLAEEAGRAALHARLSEVDRVLAEKLAPNDFVRVSRALEVYELTGTPLSRWQSEHGFREPRHAVRFVGIRRSAEELSERILRRVQAMLEAGWIDEVRSLLDRGHGDARPMRAVGYRQIADALRSGEPLDRDALAESIHRATRIFARRQRTWLRDQPVTWLEKDAARTWTPE